MGWRAREGSSQREMICGAAVPFHSPTGCMTHLEIEGRELPILPRLTKTLIDVKMFNPLRLSKVPSTDAPPIEPWGV